MNVWREGLAMGAIAGAFAFANAIVLRKWFEPRLPAGSTGVRRSLWMAGSWMIGMTAGFLYARLPLWTLLPTAGGVLVGTLLPHVFRREPDTARHS